MPQKPEIPPLLKADKATLTFYADKTGKISVAYQGWEANRVVLAAMKAKLLARSSSSCLCSEVKLSIAAIHVSSFSKKDNPRAITSWKSAIRPAIRA